MKKLHLNQGVKVSEGGMKTETKVRRSQKNIFYYENIFSCMMFFTPFIDEGYCFARSTMVRSGTKKICSKLRFNARLSKFSIVIASLGEKATLSPALT